MRKKKSMQSRWRDDLPVNLKELAELQGVSYATAVRWSQYPNFPRVGHLLRRSDFEDWWKREAKRRKPAETPAKKEPPPQHIETFTKPLPEKAARLLAAANASVTQS
jgi:hypothetical protein